MRKLNIKLTFFCITCISGHLYSEPEESLFKTIENFMWNSPIQLAYDFSEDFSSRNSIPAFEEAIDVIALADPNEMHPQIHEVHAHHSKENDMAAFIRHLVNH